MVMNLASKFKKNPLAFVILLMVFYVLFALYADAAKLSKIAIKFDYLSILPIMIPVSFNLLLLGIRFHVFLRVLDIAIPLKKSILIYLAGLVLAATPAGLGQAIKSQILKRQFGYSISRTSPIILVEKWNELMTVLLILMIFAFLNPILESTVIIIIGIAVAFLLFGMMRTKLLFSLYKKIISKSRRLKSYDESIERSQETLKVLTSRRMVLRGFLITIPAQILQALTVFFVFHAIGVKIAFVSSAQIFFSASIAGIVSFVPGGLIVTEGSMLALLIKYYHYNSNITGINNSNNNEIALLVAAVILVRLVTLWYPTLLGLITARFVMK
jgi:glycosyltransferase 2 family protein